MMCADCSITCSWDSYALMLRIYKHYAFNLQDKSAGNAIIKAEIIIYCEQQKFRMLPLGKDRGQMVTIV